MTEEFENLEKVERLMQGQMSGDEMREFEKQCLAHPEKDQKAVADRYFLKSVIGFYAKLQFKKHLHIAQSNYDIAHPLSFTKKIRYFVIGHRAVLATAAILAIIFSITTLVIGNLFFNPEDQQGVYRELRRNIPQSKKIEAHTQAIKYGGTGFLISSDGYLATNYHVVKDADSVSVENTKGELFHATVSYIDPECDLAVLKVDDFKNNKLKRLPYTFNKKRTIEIGEDLYTLGFPKDDLVYDKGYLSSKTGFAGDSIAYQVAIPVNPGNSGGPVFDTKGNLVGMITAKQTKAEGTAFAVKSKYIIKSLSNFEDKDFKITPQKNTLAGLPRTHQIKILKECVFVVKVYNN